MLYPKGNITKIVVTVGLACALSLLPGKLFAGTIEWTIGDGTTLSGGGDVSGSFVYDYSNNAYSDVDIVVGTDDGVTGETYSIVAGDSSNVELDLSNNNTESELQLYFNDFGGLNDTGGTLDMGIHLVNGGETVDVESGSGSFNASVSGSPTPEPGTTLLVLLGLAGVLGKSWYSFGSVRRFSTANSRK